MRILATQKEWVRGVAAFSILLGFLVYAISSSSAPYSNISLGETASTQEEIPTTEALPTVDETPVIDEMIMVQFNNIMDSIKTQEEVDEMLLAELNSGEYTFEEPLVVVDPYNCSPLTGVVLFKSPEPLNISIHVDGKDELSSIDFTFDGFNTDHMLPIYGLYANTENRVELTAVNEKDSETKTVLLIETQPLPSVVDDINMLVDVRIPDEYQKGFNFTYDSDKLAKKTAFDINGDFRWYLLGDYLLASNYDVNGRFIMSIGDNLCGDVFICEINPLGRIFKVLYAPFGVHHDIESFKDDSLLISGSNGETIEDIIYEINTTTGAIENYLDLKTVLQRTYSNRYIDTSNPDALLDWLHLNAIVVLEEPNKIIISSRHQSSVVKLSWPDGKIDWMSSPKTGYIPMYDEYLLDPIGDNFEQHYYQHAPHIINDADGNPDTIDFLLFDNGTNREILDTDLIKQIANNETVYEPYSRMVQYRVNEKEGTIEQIRQYGKEFGIALFSDARGDADLLPNDNWLGCFVTNGYISSMRAPTYVEIDKDGDLVWMIQKTMNNANYSVLDYRVERMPIYNVDANNLEIGIKTENLIPLQVIEKYNTNKHTGG